MPDPSEYETDPPSWPPNPDGQPKVPFGPPLDEQELLILQGMALRSIFCLEVRVG